MPRRRPAPPPPGGNGSPHAPGHSSEGNGRGLARTNTKEERLPPRASTATILRRILFSVTVCVAAASTLGTAAAGAPASSACARTPYTYAGFAGRARSYGVAATIEAVAAPRVADGHVAAWVGLGGPGAGPGGTDEWLQAGVAAFPDGGAALYYEVARPHAQPRYVEIGPADQSRPYRIAVVETPGRRSWWRVSIDGRAVGRPIYLPASHGRWAAVATGESWNAGAATCNAYRFSFGRVLAARAPAGGWQGLRQAQRLESAGYRVVGRSPDAFVATTAAR